MRIVLSRLHLADCIFQILFFRLHFQIAFSRLCFANCCSTLFGCPTKLLTFLLTHKFLVLVTFDWIHWDLPDLVDVKTFCPYLSRILWVGSHSDYKTNLSSQFNLHWTVNWTRAGSWIIRKYIYSLFIASIKL